MAPRWHQDGIKMEISSWHQDLIMRLSACSCVSLRALASLCVLVRLSACSCVSLRALKCLFCVLHHSADPDGIKMEISSPHLMRKEAWNGGPNFGFCNCELVPLLQCTKLQGAAICEIVHLLVPLGPSRYLSKHKRYTVQIVLWLCCTGLPSELLL